MMEQLHKPQNTQMHEKTKKIVFMGVPPILADMVAEGVQQGIFETSHPLECMEMSVAYLNTLLDDGIIELTEEERRGRIQAFIFHLERLLGVEQGQFGFIEKMFEGGE